MITISKKQITTVASMSIFTAILFTGTIDFSNSNMNAFAIQAGHHHIHTCTAVVTQPNCCPKHSFDCHCKPVGIDTKKCTFRLHRK